MIIQMWRWIFARFAAMLLLFFDSEQKVYAANRHHLAIFAPFQRPIIMSLYNALVTLKSKSINDEILNEHV